MSAVSSLASVLGIKETATPVTAALQKIDPVTYLPDPDMQAFQYFPETIQDSKSPEYSKRGVPGGSNPIVSFINGGERTISFPAVFTKDINPEPLSIAAMLMTGSFNLSLGDLFGGQPKHDIPSDEDGSGGIPAAIAWLRQFVYPKYEDGICFPPPLVAVFLPGSGIIGHPNFPDSIVAVMTQCDVTYEAFHRCGAPRLVTVQLAFTEVVQVGKNWGWVGSEVFEDAITYSREVIAQGKQGGLLGGLLG